MLPPDSTAFQVWGMQVANSQALPELRRAVGQKLTALEVSNHHWKTRQGQARAVLDNHLSAVTEHVHAEVMAWPPGFAAVQHGVGKGALRKKRECEAAVQPVVHCLNKIVSDMRTSSKSESMPPANAAYDQLATFRQHFIPRAVSCGTRSVGTAAASWWLVERIAPAFESALQLWPAFGSGGGETAPVWDAHARLVISAWVLEPNIEHEKLDAIFESLQSSHTV